MAEEQGGRPERRTGTYVGVGCFTAFVGFWGGGMIAVLIGKIVGSVQGCAPAENGAPCNWWMYARVGMIAGAILLPMIALWRLRHSGPGGSAATGNSD